MSFRTLHATRERLRSCAAVGLAAIFASASSAGWAALIVAIVALLAFDRFSAHRGEDDVSLRRAAGWSVWWAAVGVAFALAEPGTIGGLSPLVQVAGELDHHEHREQRGDGAEAIRDEVADDPGPPLLGRVRVGVGAARGGRDEAVGEPQQPPGDQQEARIPRVLAGAPDVVDDLLGTSGDSPAGARCATGPDAK
jgi:hypothetical protein